MSEYGVSMAFVFPEAIREREWFESFCRQYTTFCTRNDVRGSINDVEQIIRTYQPDIVHTNFEGYDLVVRKAVYKVSPQTKIVWHLHDHLGYSSNPIVLIYQMKGYLIHYGIKAKDVNVIGVSNEVTRFTRYHFNVIHPFVKRNDKVIPNGIDVKRLELNYSENPPSNTRVFTFLAFGGRNIVKRVDLLYKAAQQLRNKGVTKFMICIVKGTDTLEVFNSLCNGNIPEWCKLINPTQDIAHLFSTVDCFVSTSIAETFSYAVCEASIFGLPVIQSNIEGTIWNATNPSTYVFQNENIDDLAKRMEDVMRVPTETMRKSCEKTKLSNLAKYSIGAWCQCITEFYIRL